MEDDPTSHFLIKKHLKFLKRNLDMFPYHYSSLESHRITLLFFSLSGLEILDSVDSVLTPEHKEKIVDWIYLLQLDSKSGAVPDAWGFRGSLSSSGECWTPYDVSNLSQTYSALCCLLILGDDLSRVDRVAVLEGIKRSQLADGSFYARGQESENDMRFVYCAAAVCKILNGFDYIDVEKLCDYVRRSVSYDGGIAQGPGLESHGGSTYCAIASLSLAGRLWDYSVLSRRQIERLKKWALFKQDEGFHGRPHKPDDTCYGFWIGATIKLLGCYSCVNRSRLRSFLLICQDDRSGGFLKTPDAHPDTLHTYFSIAALSLMGEPCLMPIDPALNLPLKVAKASPK